MTRANDVLVKIVEGSDWQLVLPGPPRFNHKAYWLDVVAHGEAPAFTDFNLPGYKVVGGTIQMKRLGKVYARLKLEKDKP